MAQPNSFQSPWFSQGESYFEHGQPAPPKQPWGGSRELPGLSSSRSLSSSIYSEPKPSSSSHPVPSMNLHRNNSDQGFDNIRLSPIATRVQTQQITDPISRFWVEDGPWSSLRSVEMSPHSRGTPNGRFQSPYMEPSYRHGPNSIGSSDTGHTQDSGYASTAAYSAGGLEPETRQLHLPELEPGMNGIHFPPRSVIQPVMEHDRISDPGPGHQHRPHMFRPRSRSRGHSQRRSPPEKCPVQGCGEISKCPSDAKKHRLKHEKPFKCQIPGCKRQPGFTTINDLQRHQKSVHKMGGATKSYKCAASQCKNKDKEWPRLDNFKQHVVRMHSDEDLEDVIKRSECARKESQSQTPRPLSMDNTLAGIDDRHLAVNTSPSGLLSPDHGRAWESFHSTPSDYEARRNGNYQLYGDNGYNHDGVNIKVSPKRTDTVSTASSSGLNALAAVAAASRDSVDKSPDPVSRNGLPQESSINNNRGYQEPDNKRQKQALNPLAKAIAEGITLSNSSNESIEEQVLRILTHATTENRSENPPTSKQIEQNPNHGPGDPPISNQNPRIGAISHAQVRAGLATLADLMKKQKWKRPSTSSRTATGPFLAMPRTKQCPQCNGLFFRACDLRKHERRHLKPYGCTYPKCNKVFGSKSDWKRHENSQHFQAEVFRCQIRKPTAPFELGPGPATQKHPSHFCGELFHRREDFADHLKKEHQLSDEDQVQSQLRVHRIGRNGQSRFWCGFCGDIVELKQRRALAWDERFNHIDNHFIKEGKRVENWWCMEAGKTKGEVKKAMDRNNFEDEDVGNIDADGFGDGDEDRDRTPEAVPSGLVQDMGGPVSSSLLSKKRKRHDDDVVIFCCRCTQGPYHSKVYSACISCGHELCRACDSRLVDDGEDLNYEIDADAVE